LPPDIASAEGVAIDPLGLLNRRPADVAVGLVLGWLPLMHPTDLSATDLSATDPTDPTDPTDLSATDLSPVLSRTPKELKDPTTGRLPKLPAFGTPPPEGKAKLGMVYGVWVWCMGIVCGVWV
jgi:hypothetical protein